MVSDYKSRKNEVLASYQHLEELVSSLQAYAREIQIPDPAAHMNALLTTIRNKAEKVKADRFSIIIAGESKSGKSTFINAYLGMELLPMDVKQCTSAIVEIKYGSVFSVRATYADGRQAEITGDDEVRAFLKKNAALDDDFRDIPVPTINSEILVKSGLRAQEKGGDIVIYKAEVEAMLRSPEVQAANVHHIQNYNARIWEYIENRKNTWRDIVTKIEVMFPFEGDLRGIEIIDSPGVCVRGGVSEITSHYIENADAIIFLKPIVGQALESEQFNQFMENVSVSRNKNALFLVLTHIATRTEEDIRRLEEDAYSKFSAKLDKRNILFVDSKAELYAKKFAKTENIQDEIRRMNAEGRLDDFVLAAYLLGNGSNSDFIESLQKRSRFRDMYAALDLFGRKAHYIMMDSMLESIAAMYDKLSDDMTQRIKMYKDKATVDPKVLAHKIADLKEELEILQNKLSRGVNDVVRRFRGDEGTIRKTANEEIEAFLSQVDVIDPNSNGAFEQLEKLSMEKIDRFKEITDSIQRQVVAEFDKQLIALSDKNSIPYKSLKPDFTDETFQTILRSTESQATKQEQYTTGRTFQETHTRSVYVQDRHFEIVKKSILNRLTEIKNDLTSNLEEFVENIRTAYIRELSNNAKAKSKEYDVIVKQKISTEQNQAIIDNLSALSARLSESQNISQKLQGGIRQYV